MSVSIVKLLRSLKQNEIYPNSQKGPNALSFAIGGTSPGLMILYTLPFKDLDHVGNDERKGCFRWIKVDLTLQKLSQRCLQQVRHPRCQKFFERLFTFAKITNTLTCIARYVVYMWKVRHKGTEEQGDSWIGSDRSQLLL